MTNHLKRVGTGMCVLCNYPHPKGLYEQEDDRPLACIDCLNDESTDTDPVVVQHSDGESCRCMYENRACKGCPDCKPIYEDIPPEV